MFVERKDITFLDKININLDKNKIVFFCERVYNSCNRLQIIET